jgi:hypothetical protein
MSTKTNSIGCSSGRVKIVDPNDFNGFDSSDNVPVALEDLNISVALTSFKKGRTVLTKGDKIDDVKVYAQTSKTLKVNFIEGSDITGDGKRHLTTAYTDLITSNVDGVNEETLGITSIDIEFNSSYAPLITINFVDVRGSSIFQNEYRIKNSESKYTTFFQLPYPLFELEIKGFYGLPVKYCLHMYKFNSKFNSKTGNFEITANFVGYTYAMLSDMLLGYLKAVGETTLGKERYAVYNEGKADPVPTLNELATQISQINPGLSDVNKEEGGGYQEASESIDIIDDISGQMDTLGSNIDKDAANKAVFDFIVLKKDTLTSSFVKSKIEEEYQKKVYNKDDEESLVLKFNEKSSSDKIVTANWVFKYDTSGDGNRVYKGLTLDKLNNATTTDLISYFGNYTTNDDTLNDLKDCLSKYHTSLSNNEVIDVIDMRLLKQILKYKKDNAINKQKSEKSALADSYKDAVKSKLGFEPTARPMIECFTAAIEVLSECIFLVAQATGSHTERTNELKKAFKLEGSGSKNSDVKGRFLSANDYLPWPAYQEYDVDKKAYVEKYLGASSAIENVSNIDELVFIDELHEGFKKSQQKQEENDANLNNETIDAWFAVNPMDLKDFSDQKPYTRFKPKTADEVNAVMLIRAITFLGYTNNFLALSEDEIKAMAKIEAEAIIRDIEDTEDKKIKRELTQKTVDTILQTQAIVNSRIRPVLKDVGGSYEYNYLYDQTDIRVIPVNKGFIDEGWGNPNDGFDKEPKKIVKVLRENKADEGYIYLTNYSSASIKNKSFYKEDDGGVYLKIIKKEDITAGQLPSEIIGENIINYEALKKDEITNSSDAQAAGFNSLGSQYGIQEYVNMNFNNDNIPIENTFKYVFYKTTFIDSKNLGANISERWVGLAYTKESTYKIINGKDGSTSSDSSFVKNESEKIHTVNTEPANYINTSKDGTNLHEGVGKNRTFLASDNDNITYPYITVGKNDESKSLFGSYFYYDLYHSKIFDNKGKFVINCQKQARAMAFLHSLPFNVTGDNPFGSPAIINTFRYKGGVIHAPRLWCAYVGSVIWRNSTRLPVIEDGKIVGGGSGSKDPIYWGDYDCGLGIASTLLGAPCYKRSEYFPFSLGNNPQKDIEDNDVINRLPIQVKNEFIKVFLDFVTGNGPTDWPSLRTELEIYDTTNNNDQSAGFRALVKDLKDNDPTYNKIFSKNDVNGDIIKKNYYIFALNQSDGQIWLTLNDKCDATDKLIKALKEEVIILNNNYKIWSSDGGGDTERAIVKVEQSRLKTYLDQVVEVYKSNEDSFNKAKEDKRLDNTIFGTSNKDEIKLGLYRTCKNIYDKWLAGANNVEDLLFQCGSRSVVDGFLAKKYGNNRARLIDSFRFVSRAFSDIGDLLYIDPTPINEWIGNNTNMSSYEAITSILASNNFEFIPLPNFINFNDKENLESIFKPYNYSTDRVKNGTCGPSFVCVYAGQSSQHLDYYDNEYKDDGFDLRCDKGNIDPSIPEDFTSEVNADYEEPIGAFSVKYSQQNQNLFKDITLDQSEFTETDESLQIQDDIAQKGRENNKSYMGQNIYNVYAVRSYTAEIEMMGNAMIQPMMYFQLDNIPMFHGAYMITSVSHSIIPNSMKTKFKGVRIKYTKTPLVTAKEVYENLIENSDFSNSENGGGGGGGGKRASGTYEPIVATLIENGVENGYIDFGKTYGCVTTKKLTGGSKKYFNVTANPDYIIAEGAVAFDKMLNDFGDWMVKEGYKKNSAGYFGHIGSTYRSYASQAAIKAGKNGKIAASAGKSYHGWGLAIDWGWNDKSGKQPFTIKSSGSSDDEFKFDKNPALKWLYDNSYKYGFINPSWARDGNNYQEVWHWEYHGTSAMCLVKASPNVVGGYKIPVPDDAKYDPIVKNPKKSDCSENVFDKNSCKGVKVKGDGTEEGGSIKGAVQTSDAETLSFFKKLLQKLGAPETDGNLLFLKAFRQAEGAKATWNPFNSTQKKKGATNYNKKKVKNYKTEADGLDATYETLTNGLYPNLVKAFKDGMADKTAAYNVAVKLQKKGGDLCIWVKGPTGCAKSYGIASNKYVAQILNSSKISGNNIWKPKEGSDKNEKSTPDKSKNKPKTLDYIVYGGLAPYGAKWMEEQWIAAGLPTDAVIFEEYNGRTTAAIIKSYTANGKCFTGKGVFGFSAGGQQVWGEPNGFNFSVIGLIDPSTRADDVEGYLTNIKQGGTRVMFNPTNWTGKYKFIGNNLLKLKKAKTDKTIKLMGGQFDRDNLFPVNDKHTDIPLKFFKKFKDLIENATYKDCN